MKKKSSPRSRVTPQKAVVVPPPEDTFNEIVSLIQAARARSLQFVNSELVGLYWQIGKYISSKLAAAEWGEGVVDQLAQHLARTMPGLHGFTRRNLFRMRQFFETYAGDEKVSPLVTQLPWTHNLIILGQSDARRAGVLPTTNYSGAVVQPRTGTAAPSGRLRADGASKM